MTNDTFKIGYVAQRKTGGPEMLVSKATEDRVWCISYVHERVEFDEREFKADQLKVVRRTSVRPEPFEVDDQVYFRLGSTRMLVTQVSPDRVRCSWYVDSTTEDKGRDFAPELLELTRESADPENLEPAIAADDYNIGDY